MKVTTLLNRPVLATLLLSASVTVFAAGGGGGPRGSGPSPWSPTASSIGRMPANAGPTVPLRADTAPVATGGAVQGKTRAQVRAELLQAEEAGLTPVHKNDYPPSAETVARNRVRFQEIEQAWMAGGHLTASDQ